MKAKNIQTNIQMYSLLASIITACLKEIGREMSEYKLTVHSTIIKM